MGNGDVDESIRRAVGIMLRRLTSADYKIMPWKNGGGSTTELYVEPGRAGGFLWRVSIASVASDGPFSQFAGYDRHIMALDGGGMLLKGGPAGDITVSPALVPGSFAGDWPITATLLAGPIRDFNLITLRASCRGRIECFELRGAQSFEPGGCASFIHMLRGTATFAPGGDHTALGEGNSLLFSGELLNLRASNGPALFALCRINSA